MTEVKGRIRFSKLIVDGVCPYDKFCEQIRHEGNLTKQLNSAISIMDQVANLKRLPKVKFNDITPKNDRIKEFEIKKGDLRIYLIKEAGHIVIIAGKKGNQKADINRFQSLKAQYLQSKQERS